MKKYIKNISCIEDRNLIYNNNFENKNAFKSLNGCW